MNFITSFTLNDFKEMEELEKKFYDENHITPYEEVYKWYEKYPYTICALKDDDKIIGFINLFPIKKTIFAELKNGRFNDKNLTLDGVYDISKNSEEPIQMFLSCIVVDQDFQRKGIAKKLLQESFTHYDHLIERINFIITDNVTKDGVIFRRSLG